MGSLARALMVVTPLLLAGSTAAAPLKWQGTLSFDLAITPPMLVTGTGVATVNASSGLGHLNQLRLAGGISGSERVTVTESQAISTQFVTAVSAQPTLGTGTLAASAGAPASARTLPIRGTLRWDLLLGPLDLPLSFHRVLSAPGGVGVGGTWDSLPHLTLAKGFRISIMGAPWTIGAASALQQTGNVFITTLTPTFGQQTVCVPASTVTLTAAGFAHGPASLTSSTALPSGLVRFVSPIQIRAFLDPPTPPGAPDGYLRLFGGFAGLRIRFVPEPSALVLLVSGAGALLLLGCSRR